MKAKLTMFKEEALSEEQFSSEFQYSLSPISRLGKSENITMNGSRAGGRKGRRDNYLGALA